MKGVRLILKGRVQGVGYRYFAMKEAEKLGINGYVRNLPDGSVEVVYIPDNSEKEQIFLQRLKKGPFLARVDGVERTEITLPDELSGFEIRY